MLYIVSQNGLRIADLHTISVLPPEHDLEDDGVYKVYVNGAEFARYTDWSTVERVMEEIEKFIHINQNTSYRLTNDGGVCMDRNTMKDGGAT